MLYPRNLIEDWWNVHFSASLQIEMEFPETLEDLWNVQAMFNHGPEYKISSMYTSTNLWGYSQSTSSMESWNTEGHWHSPTADVEEGVKLIWDRRHHWSKHSMVVYPQILFRFSVEVELTGNTLTGWWRTLGSIGNHSRKQLSPNFRTAPVDQDSTQLCWTNHGRPRMMSVMDSWWRRPAEQPFCYWLNLVGWFW